MYWRSSQFDCEVHLPQPRLWSDKAIRKWAKCTVGLFTGVHDEMPEFVEVPRIDGCKWASQSK